jgi:hypothetical protein
MSNRLTVVPAAPVPAPGPLARAVLPVADLFMLAMLSRPASGSLRTTWVTPATLWLSLATSLVLAAGAVLLPVALTRGPSGIAGAALCAALAVGAAAVVIVGLGQRVKQVA